MARLSNTSPIIQEGGVVVACPGKIGGVTQRRTKTLFGQVSVAPALMHDGHRLSRFGIAGCQFQSTSQSLCGTRQVVAGQIGLAETRVGLDRVGISWGLVGAHGTTTQPESADQEDRDAVLSVAVETRATRHGILVGASWRRTARCLADGEKSLTIKASCLNEVKT